MRNVFFALLCISCTQTFDGTFNSDELTSSKGEKIYINSLNWGVTDDYQITAISHSKGRLQNKADTLNVVKGLEPFFYSFKNDSLNLYFNSEVTYTVEENFHTIAIVYKVLNNKEFNIIRHEAYENRGYYSIPKRKKVLKSLDIPIPTPKSSVTK